MSDDADFINVNLDEVEDSFPVWPEGVHPIRVTAVERKQKEGSQYPYLNLELTHADGDANCKGHIFLVLSFHPKALWNMKAFVSKAGVKWTPQGFHYTDLLNKTLRVTVGQEPSQKDASVTVNNVKPPYHAG